MIETKMLRGDPAKTIVGIVVAIVILHQQAVSSTVDGIIRQSTDNAVVVLGANFSGDSAMPEKANDNRVKRQFGSYALALSNQAPCFTSVGGLGRCVMLSKCYPYFKLPDILSKTSPNLGIQDTCTFYSNTGIQVYGVCCTKLEHSDVPQWPLYPFLPPVDPISEEEFNSVYGFQQPNWPPPIPTHPPDHTIPPLPTHPPYPGFPNFPTTTGSSSAAPSTTKTTHKPSHWSTTSSHPTTSRTTTTSSTTTATETELLPHNETDCGVKNGYQDQERIVGGQNAEPGEWPWMAAILNNGRLFCGGSLIDDVHILTAAHCVAHMNPWDVARLRVNLGDHNIKIKGEVQHVERRVKKVVRHRGFDPRTLYNDIALLTLDSPVQFTKQIRPICLPYGSKSLYTGKTATVIGWGSVREMGPTPAILQKVNIPIWTNGECKIKYGGAAPGGIVDHFLCAGKISKDSCSGDSGGPLMLNDGKWTQIGIVSWGIGCGKSQFPGVYTRLTSFMPWIVKNLNV